MHKSFQTIFEGILKRVFVAEFLKSKLIKTRRYDGFSQFESLLYAFIIINKIVVIFEKLLYNLYKIG